MTPGGRVQSSPGALLLSGGLRLLWKSQAWRGICGREVESVSRRRKAGLGFGVRTRTVGAPEGRGVQSGCGFYVLIFLNVH